MHFLKLYPYAHGTAIAGTRTSNHSPLQKLSADARFPDLGTEYKNV